MKLVSNLLKSKPSQKNLVLAIILPIFLGPIGLLYAAPIGALIMTALFFLTLGLGGGWVLLAICIAWSVLEAIGSTRTKAFYDRWGLALRFSYGGLILGGAIGFFARPSIPLLGQVPLGEVLTGGRYLNGLDALLLSTAQKSWNLMVICAILGAVLAAAFGFFATGRQPPTPSSLHRNHGKTDAIKVQLKESYIDKLGKLAQLRDQGVLSEREYQHERKKLLNAK